MSRKETAFAVWMDGSEMTGNEVTKFDEQYEFATLKDAVKTLRRLGDMHFDQNVADKHKLTRLIESAQIIDRSDKTVVLSKFQAKKDDFDGVSEGIYIMLNEKKMSVQELKEQTGYDLGRFPRTGRDGNLFRVATTADLQLSTGMARKMTEAAKRLLLPLRTKRRIG